MPKKLRSDDDDLMEIFRQHYAELRREHSEYEDTVHKLECEVAGLRGRVDQLEELNKRLTEERDQFLERYYRLVTQFELIGGGVDRAPASATRLDSCGAGQKSTSRTNCRRCQRRSRSAMPTVSLRMASPRLPQHWAASTGPPPSKARRSRSNKSKCFPIAVSGGFLLAKKTASETALNKPNRFIS
jgi:hypothetical protein